MITLEQTDLDTDTFGKGVEFQIPLDGNWITVAQFFNKKKEKADRFFVHNRDTDELSEIGYRTFKRTIGEFIGHTVFESLLHSAEEEEELKPELDGFKLAGITLLEQH